MTFPKGSFLLFSFLAACAAPAPSGDAQQTAPAAAAERAAESPERPAEAPVAAERAAEVPAAEAAEPASILISAVGDCTLASDSRSPRAEGSFDWQLKSAGNDYRYNFSGVLSVLGADDLTIANLETTLATTGSRADRPITFRGDPANVAILRAGSVELVNFANNHSYDFGPASHEQTIEVVLGAGVGIFGDERVDRRTVHGVEVVNLGYTGGRASIADRVARDVRAAKRDDSLVIVSFHWGSEGSGSPLPEQRLLGHAALDAGADLVLGHHPHVLQGIEERGGRRIVYSLGNFVFGGHSHPADMDSMIYQQAFHLRDGKVQAGEPRVIPVRISSSETRNDYRPVLLEGAERDRVLARVAALSASIEPARAPGRPLHGSSARRER